MKTSKFLLMLSVFAIGLMVVVSKPTKRYRYDADFLDSEIQRIRSGRAEEIEPGWAVSKSSAVSEAPVNTDHDKDEDDDDEDGSSSGEDYYGSSEEIEITCAPGKGWHMRGQRCVPVNCPGGPSERDFNTGECLYSYQPKGRFTKPFQQWNDLNHVYRSSPMSSHIFRSMMLMRKG